MAMILLKLLHILYPVSPPISPIDFTYISPRNVTVLEHLHLIVLALLQFSIVLDRKVRDEVEVSNILCFNPLGWLRINLSGR